MKTIKIIDLLNKIANDEELPFTIKYYGKVYDLKNDGCFDYYVTDDRRLLLDELESTSQLKDIVEILDEEDEFEDIEEITLEGQVIGYGILSKWLGSRQTDKEKKLCSAIECLGTGLNALIKNQKKIIDKINKLNI